MPIKVQFGESSQALPLNFGNTTVVPIPGPPGPPGQKGDPGEPGQKGDPGTPGAYPIGLNEMAGDSTKTTYRLEFSNGQGYDFDVYHGEPGQKGDPGEPGQKGDPGEPGQKGDPGEPGAKGDKGDPGAKGDKGDPGEPGAKGDKGDPGEPGAKGDKGDPGEPGQKGDPGEPGQKGDPGEPGSIETPKIVSSVSEMTDTTKHYVNQETGTIWANKTITTTTAIENNEYDSSYTTGLNLRLSTNDGTHRTGAKGRYTTDYISITPTAPYMVTLDGLSTDLVNVDSSYYMVHYFGADKSYIGYAVMTVLGHSPSSGALPMSFDISKYSNFSNAEYVRITVHISTSAITTANCEGLVINFAPKNVTETTTGKAWTDTGITYAPTFKTDIIGVLGENGVIYISDNALPPGTYTLKADNASYATIGEYIVE